MTKFAAPLVVTVRDQNVSRAQHLTRDALLDSGAQVMSVDGEKTPLTNKVKVSVPTFISGVNGDLKPVLHAARDMGAKDTKW